MTGVDPLDMEALGTMTALDQAMQPDTDSDPRPAGSPQSQGRRGEGKGLPSTDATRAGPGGLSPEMAAFNLGLHSGNIFDELDKLYALTKSHPEQVSAVGMLVICEFIENKLALLRARIKHCNNNFPPVVPGRLLDVTG